MSRIHVSVTGKLEYNNPTNPNWARKLQGYTWPADTKPEDEWCTQHAYYLGLAIQELWGTKGEILLPIKPCLSKFMIYILFIYYPGLGFANKDKN